MTALVLPKVFLSGAQVRNAAERHGWSMRMLAGRAGVRADDLSRACTGTRPMPVERAVIIAHTLGVPLAQLLALCPVCASPQAVHDHRVAS